MLKFGLEVPSFEKTFIRQALQESGLRLDGRGTNDFREVSIEMSRTEISSTSEIHLGNTIVVAAVTGEVVAPYPDRPSEGILLFSVEVSPMTEAKGGTSQTENLRLLERSIRESEAIDTESLCVIGGAKVWQIKCEVTIIDASGGNVIDASMLAAIAALRAFRKPETSVIADSEAGSPGVVVFHHSNDREPLPLALQHSPLTVTVALFRYSSDKKNSTNEPLNIIHKQQQQVTQENVIIVVDPSSQEIAAMDGKLMFSINAHKELCAMSKPGGVGLNIDSIIKASELAAKHAANLHLELNKALALLEKTIEEEKLAQLEILRKYTSLSKESLYESSTSAPIDTTGSRYISGVDKDDPILAWTNLHSAAVLKSVD